MNEETTMAKKPKTLWEANQLVLRVTENIKDAMRAKADKQGLSLNAWANRVLARATGVTLPNPGRGNQRKGQ
jgi:predicted HicB family RNase H-like nuclease